ncbi:MAG: FadR/GntR family transcriptional regulator [Rhodospirillales bacterium]|nr:FadR/GntR family transcriptional regulator [Rhodospirillales bacterium]
MPFQVIEPQRMYQQIANQVAGLIQQGQFKPGERLPPERDLAKEFGVSRNVVREAMVALELVGLIEVRIGAGTFVQSNPGRALPFVLLRQDDVGPGPFELLAVRRVVEGEIAFIAAKAATDEQLLNIRDALIRMERDPMPYRISRNWDRIFHGRIAAATNNTVLVSIVDGMWKAMLDPMFETFSQHTRLPEYHRMTIGDHRAILSALDRRDPAGARRAMDDHLMHVEGVLSQADDLAIAGDPEQT